MTSELVKNRALRIHVMEVFAFESSYLLWDMFGNCLDLHEGMAGFCCQESMLAFAYLLEGLKKIFRVI